MELADGRPVLAAAADDVLGALLDLKSSDFLDEAEAQGPRAGDGDRHGHA